ncbi:methylated-DNA--[protein]-cysteine S-methyltransferase [Hazenella sp. IB182357]|uniref:Methylated-DNA--protein-cysteine methyltransferase n=1 Tax=Polycladospora coralii TaxID=2771432 RepID=A0A926RUV3_9BACL|nr:methylated-DNA--[protein]-cysteine S-methyltransferase [Polycladospora coralii]MBD1373052.1 methylated-DNA--[protein]-cysteine S-methyltransferase [Polycladospora coralii]MBS7529603.1 methylated-DNA--[protein]-cysteine S-methyltransferase [Polycladospora coralii]
MKQTIVWSKMESPVGLLTLAASTNGLCYLTFNKKNNSEVGLDIWLNHWLRNVKLEYNEVETLPYIEQMIQYFAGERKIFDMPVALYGTPFQKMVWNQLTTIPYGEVRSYKEVAQGIGSPKAVRAVGGANNKNPISIVVPCHRVIGSNGSLVGYGGGMENKKFLLSLEGFQSKVKHNHN